MVVGRVSLIYIVFSVHQDTDLQAMYVAQTICVSRWWWFVRVLLLVLFLCLGEEDGKR